MTETASPTDSPHGVYTAAYRERQAEAERLGRACGRLSNARLVVFVLGVGLGWLVWEEGWLSSWWMLAPLVVFAVLAWRHDRAIRRRERAERSARFYARGLARLEDRWAGQGDGGERFLPEEHAYARDLDLFGRGSLFELLATTRTSWGASTLAAWLREPAEVEEARARQAAVEELRGRLALREDLAILADETSDAVAPEALVRWAEAPAWTASLLTRAVALVLGIAGLVAVVAWLGSFLGRLPALVILGAELLFALRYRERVQRVIASVEEPARQLLLLNELVRRLERESFTSPRLGALKSSLATEADAASLRIRRLRRLIDVLDARRNQLFAPVAALVLWGTQSTFALEAWRSRSGASVRRWIEVTGELDALLALSGYAYEHPGDPFPKLVEDGEDEEDGASLEGEGLGHPLIPESRLIRNDVRLGGELRLLVVSGSNMSGKSTLLRTVGINVVLALSGAPVHARRLRLSRLQLGASIRIQDSLQEGISHFYAEIRRLRLLMDLTAGPLPVLFLLDEILQGTNSHDRRIGAEAVVRGLLDRGALGLITTHDLALTRVAEALAPRASNVHFQDHLEEGQMRFDYRMRPGVVEKSNALELMRSVGLDV